MTEVQKEELQGKIERLMKNTKRNYENGKIEINKKNFSIKEKNPEYQSIKKNTKNIYKDILLGSFLTVNGFMIYLTNLLSFDIAFSYLMLSVIGVSCSFLGFSMVVSAKRKHPIKSFLEFMDLNIELEELNDELSALMYRQAQYELELDRYNSDLKEIKEEKNINEDHAYQIINRVETQEIRNIFVNAINQEDPQKSYVKKYTK